MIRSEKGKFIFVHVQKNAGMSFEAILKKNFSDSDHWHGRHGHALTGIREVGREEWDEYYSFAFVRNPWDRMVSWYSMIQKNLEKLPAAQRASKEPFINSPFFNQVVLQSHDFESFLHNCTEVVFDRGCLKSFAFNQMDYLTDERGDIAVSFVGRFENLIDDSSVVFDQLGIKAGPLGRFFQVDSLPKRNTSQHMHYSHYYNRETRDLIEKRFEKDIEAFGYHFESPE